MTFQGIDVFTDRVGDAYGSTSQAPGREDLMRTYGIGRMAQAKPLWGAPRIHGELRKLGLAISPATVS
jgi:hypothetical protein